MLVVTLTGFIRVPVADLKAVLEELPTHIELTCAEEGCLLFQVDQDADDPTTFHVHEQFTDRASFTAHQERVRASRWGTITVNVQRHYRIVGLEQ